MLSAARLREVLDYDPETGVFRWRQNRLTQRVGEVAGHTQKRGYVLIFIDKKPYYGHRLAWLYVHGRWPAALIDHKNGSKSDNRLCNLREATPGQNQANSITPINNKSGVKGVCWNKARQKWQATIRVDMKTVNLGCFASKTEAQRAYRNAALRYKREFARTD